MKLRSSVIYLALAIPFISLQVLCSRLNVEKFSIENEMQVDFPVREILDKDEGTISDEASVNFEISLTPEE